MACPIRNVMKQTISLTMIIDNARTINLPSMRRTRLGTAARVVRIDPDEYSLVMNKMPITPTAKDAKYVPARLVDPASKVRRSVTLDWFQWPRIATVISAPRPMVSTNVNRNPMIVERTERNLIHSEWVVDIRVTSLLTVRRFQGRTAVLDRVGGEIHEDLFERGALGCQLENRHARVERGATDLV